MPATLNAIESFTKADGPFGLLGANGANTFGEWVSAVIQGGGILHDQDYLSSLMRLRVAG